MISQPSEIGRIAALATFALVMEMICAFLFFREHLLPALFLHVIVVVMIARSIAVCRRNQRDMRLQALLFVLVAAAGPTGAIGGWLMIALYSYYSRRTASFMDWFADLFPQEDLPESDQLHERIVCGLEDMREQDIESYHEILSGGALQEKQAAIVKMTRYFNPSYLPLLRKALADEWDSALRVHAATALAKIERDYVQRFRELENESRVDANNPEKLQRYASFCESYVHSGIADAVSVRSIRQRAIDAYERLLEFEAARNNPEILLALGRLYQSQGDWSKSRHYFETYLSACDAIHETPQAGGITGFMDTLYYLGSFGPLREMATRYAYVLDNTSGVSALSRVGNMPDRRADESALVFSAA